MKRALFICPFALGVNAFWPIYGITQSKSENCTSVEISSSCSCLCSATTKSICIKETPVYQSIIEAKLKAPPSRYEAGTESKYSTTEKPIETGKAEKPVYGKTVGGEQKSVEKPSEISKVEHEVQKTYSQSFGGVISAATTAPTTKVNIPAYGQTIGVSLPSPPPISKSVQIYKPVETAKGISSSVMSYASIKIPQTTYEMKEKISPASEIKRPEMSGYGGYSIKPTMSMKSENISKANMQSAPPMVMYYRSKSASSSPCMETKKQRVECKCAVNVDYSTSMEMPVMPCDCPFLGSPNVTMAYRLENSQRDYFEAMRFCQARQKGIYTYRRSEDLNPNCYSKLMISCPEQIFMACREGYLVSEQITGKAYCLSMTDLMPPVKETIDRARIYYGESGKALGCVMRGVDGKRKAWSPKMCTAGPLPLPLERCEAKQMEMKVEMTIQDGLMNYIDDGPDGDGLGETGGDSFMETRLKV